MRHCGCKHHISFNINTQAVLVGQTCSPFIPFSLACLQQQSMFRKPQRFWEGVFRIGVCFTVPLAFGHVSLCAHFLPTNIRSISSPALAGQPLLCLRGIGKEGFCCFASHSLIRNTGMQFCRQWDGTGGGDSYLYQTLQFNASIYFSKLFLTSVQKNR